MKGREVPGRENVLTGSTNVKLQGCSAVQGERG